VVHPAHRRGRVVAGEPCPVEVPEEVLRAGATGGPAPEHGHHQHPAGLLRAVDPDLEQVGRLPGAAVRAVAAAERAGRLPGEQVGGPEQRHLVTGGDHHHPVVVPEAEHLGVPEVDQPLRRNEDRVAVVRTPRRTAVDAERDPLRLGDLLEEVGVERHERARPEPRDAVPVDHGASGERGAEVVGDQGDRLVLPADQVAAGGMAPVHRSPEQVGGVVLVEEVEDAVDVDEPVGVVHPPVRWREVDEGPGGWVRHGQRLSPGRGGAGAARRACPCA
jgi:hypothetical protein